MTEIEINQEKDLEKVQFQQELNKLFESKGIIADLRSHLRHLMISALQNTQVGLKPIDGSSPKAQALNLLVGEYLFRHRCDYTLSVFTSEVPTLANFNPEGRIKYGKPLDSAGKLPRTNCFGEKEVDEILNALGMCSREEELAYLKSRYLEKGNDVSLVELFLEAVVEMSTKLHLEYNLESHAIESERILSKNWSSRIVDILLSVKIGPPQITALEEAIFRLTESELRKILENERKTQVNTLVDREKRIQEYLKRHEEEMFIRLIKAEKTLKSRKKAIDEELSGREKRLIDMAVEWKNKHEEILRLSKNFHNLENENRNLEQKVKDLEEENVRLKNAEKNQEKAVVKLEEEISSLMRRIEELKELNVSVTDQLQTIMRENKELRNNANQEAEKESVEKSVDEIPLLWSKYNKSDINKDESEPKLKSKKFTIKSPIPEQHLNERSIPEPIQTRLSSGDAEPCHPPESDSEENSLSTSFEEIIKGAKNKLETLEKETQKINENYFEFKLKCITENISDPESSRSLSPDIQTEVPKIETQIEVSKETKFSQTVSNDVFAKIQKLKEEKTQEFGLNKKVNNELIKKFEEKWRTKLNVRPPTKRQLQHREFFLKNRQLLHDLEKKDVLDTSPSVLDSTSGDEISCYQKSPLKALSPVRSEHSVEVHKSPKDVEKRTMESSPVLKTDLDCLALLEETRIKTPHAVKSLRQNILVSESDKEDGEGKKSDTEKEGSESGSSSKISVGKKTSDFW